MLLEGGGRDTRMHNFIMLYKSLVTLKTLLALYQNVWV